MSETMEKFIELDEVQELILDADMSEGVERFKKNLIDDDAIIADLIDDDFVDVLMGRTVYDAGVPDDNNEAIIDGVLSPEEIKIDHDSLRYYGEGEFGLDISFEIESMLTYYIYKANYFGMSGDARLDYVSITDHNNHYFEAQEDLTVFVTGTVSFMIDVKKLQQSKSFERCFKSPTLKFESIESLATEYSSESRMV